MPVDVFVSYAGPDRPWAEWVASQVEAAGRTVELDVWDWAPGSNAVLKMNDALTAGQVVALYSKAYFERDRFTGDEWTAVLAQRPDAEGRRRLVPLRLEDVKPPPVLAPLVYVDLFGLDEAHARDAVLSAVLGPRRPTGPVPFPGAVAVSRLPGSLPQVWNVPPRLSAFTGRTALLAGLRERLTSGDRAVVQALHGMGGVGKTQLAIEYAHLFAGDYDLVWWIDAERPELIGEQVAALGSEMGWVQAGTADATTARTVMARLRRLSRWLIVFDNVETAHDLEPWLPPQTGHTVITSRSAGFRGMAAAVSVDVFARAESVALIRQYLPTLSPGDADRLAHALGDLPLALAQAVGLMEEIRIPVAAYLAELDGQAHRLLAEGRPLGYPVPLAAAVELSTRRLAAKDPAAVRLLHLCAHLAPEPIPLPWFSAAPEEVLGETLAAVAATSFAFHRSLGRLAQLGLARITEHTIQLHRLTQAVLRDQQAPAEWAEYRQLVERLVAAAEPGDDGTDPRSWPAWTALLPHLLALDPATAGEKIRSTACNALWYLLMRGDYATALLWAAAWHRGWLERLGPDDVHTLWAANQEAEAHRSLGHYAQARAINEQTLAQRRKSLGDDDARTLVSANNLAVTLWQMGEHEAARVLNEDLLERRRRTLGEDDQSTLVSAHNLATNLWEAGEYEQARALNEDTLERRRRTLGADHLYTLTSANNLAVNLRGLNDHEGAAALDEDTLERRRRVLGPDHPDTLVSAENLASTLRQLGRNERAQALEDDTRARRRRLRGEEPGDHE
ncbi:FxSxx-COOH system tetratricopeptide repeat protein [Phytohabitans kaempferiae]|uniref:FxSxx-COOH system tetratricopeptide repeat protein n=1 Tax=Phytohabitans kaempferiae TaxID=1620943 RepID=A0ABV6LZM1_9ACTN